MIPRTIAVGDVHGCTLALQAVVAAVDPSPEDTVVMLGDCVDRGPDSRGTIEFLLQLREHCRLVPLLGNHEEMMLAYLDGQPHPESWLQVGGRQTLASYDQDLDPERVDKEHIDFIRSWGDIWENDDFFCVHGNYIEDEPLAQQRWQILRWISLYQRLPDPHISGKTAVVGHSHQSSGEVFDVGYLKCIDTYCYGGGWLTALELGSNHVWQADLNGRLRSAAPGSQ